MGKIIYDDRPHFDYRQHVNNQIGFIDRKPFFINAVEMIKCTYYKKYDISADLFLKTYGRYLSNEHKKFLIAYKSPSKIKSRIYLLTLKGFTMSIT